MQKKNRKIMKMKLERWKTWKEKEEDDSSIAPLMEMSRCVRKTEKESNDDSSSKEKNREEKESGSSTQSKTKHCVMNKMASGSKDMFTGSTGKRDDDTKNKEVTIIILQKI